MPAPAKALLPLTLLLAGCALSPAYLLNRAELERSLPSGIHLDDYVEEGALGMRVTVGVKLARLGAYAGPDGKLHDASGREIVFFRHPACGQDPGPEFFRRSEEELRELKKRCTVIEIWHDPRLPRPC